MKPVLISSVLLKQFPEITFGFTTKIGLNRPGPYYFNVSHSVNDSPDVVNENRRAVYEELGLKEKNIALQKQTHSSNITFVNHGGVYSDSDALITDKSDLGLAISSADCTSVYIYNPVNKIIAGIHSGWRGTQKQIVIKTIAKFTDEYNCKPEDLYVFIAPSISQENYEVGKEVADLFPQEFVLEKNSKLYLDVAGANYKMLIDSGIPASQIEHSKLCSFKERDLLHSYRRDGSISGRAFGIIAMKNYD